MRQILIVEDDRNLNNGIKAALGREYVCIQAFSLKMAEDSLKHHNVDLILLDVNLPDGCGMDFMTKIRRWCKIPIIMLTANKMEMDIVAGLEMGANDYITKPFSLMILRARVAVQLRRETCLTGVYQCGEYCFDFNKMEFMKKGILFDLSKTEQRLLRILIENKGKSLSRSQLIDYVWQGESQYVDEHALTVVVNRLRNKLEDYLNHPEYIKTVYGVGYVWTQV